MPPRHISPEGRLAILQAQIAGYRAGIDDAAKAGDVSLKAERAARFEQVLAEVRALCADHGLPLPKDLEP